MDIKGKLRSANPNVGTTNLQNATLNGYANNQNWISDWRKNNYQMADAFGIDFRDDNRQSVTLAATRSFIHGFIYAKGKLWGSDLWNPNAIYRFNNPDDLSDYDAVAIAPNDNFQDGYDIIYSTYKDKIYSITNDQGDTGFSYLVEINPDTLAYSNVYNVDTGFFEFQSLATNGRYVYIGTGTSSTIGKVIKVDLNDYSATSQTYSSFGPIHCLRYDGTYLYATTYTGGKIIKISPSDLSVVTSAAAIDSHPTDDLCFVGDYIYVAHENGTGKISKIKKSDFSITSISTGVVADCYDAFFDGRYVWCAFNTSPGTIVRITPETEDLASITLSSGENTPNEIVSDGQRLFITCFLNPAKVVRIVPSKVDPIFRLNAVITPSAITSNQNDYNPTGLTTANVVRISGDADGRTITGLVGGIEGKVIMLHNQGTNTIYLSHESGSSTAANRFSFPSAVGVVLAPEDNVILQYDPADTRWKMRSSTPSSGVYVPTLTNSLNVSSSSVYGTDGNWSWMRVGNVVSVSGQVNINATAANADTQLGFSLPISMTGCAELAGTAACYDGTNSVFGQVYSTGIIEYYSKATGSKTFSVHFQYRIDGSPC